MKYLISHINIYEEKLIVLYNKCHLFYMQAPVLNLNSWYTSDRIYSYHLQQRLDISIDLWKLILMEGCHKGNGYITTKVIVLYFRRSYFQGK